MQRRRVRSGISVKKSPRPTILPPLQTRLWHASRSCPFRAAAGMVVVAALAVGIVWWSTGRAKPTEILTIAPVVATSPAARHPLTGAPLSAALSAIPPVAAVVIENSAEAWPLAGVEDAFLVIEAPAEASIPRFLAFFDLTTATDAPIGPVRSARPYFLSWGSEFGALFAHVGGSPAAMQALAAGMFPLTNVDEIAGGSVFWRSAQRAAPHNTYTTTERLTRAVPEGMMLSYAPTIADERTPDGGQAAGSATLDWSEGTLYDIAWDYDLTGGNYQRMRSGIPVRSADGDNITAENVIVIATDITILDAVGRREIVTVGEGDALALRDGIAVPVRWKKSAGDARLQFFVGDAEYPLKPGTTWIEVIEDLTNVTLQE